MGTVIESAARAEDSLGINEIRAKARTAFGWDAFVRVPQGILLEGACHNEGLDGKFLWRLSPRGEFLERMESRIGHQIGFDGKAGWRVDESGTPWILEFADLELERLRLAILAGYWLADDSAIQVSRLPGKADAAEVRLGLRLQADGLMMELVLDRATWLPKQSSYQGMLGRETWDYQDFRSELGITLPHRVVHRLGDLVDRFEIKSCKPARASEKNVFQMPQKMRPIDTRFDSSIPARVEVKRTPSGHLFVRPKINGKDVGWFAFDTGTGASMTISASVADQLGLPAFGKHMGAGAGKPTPMQFRQCKTLQLGPVEIADSICAELPRKFTEAMSKLFGFECAGTLGSGFLSRTVAELDLSAPALSIHDPATYRLPAGRWEGIRFSHQIPCLTCKFEGREGVFRFDTGAGMVVLFHAPAVAKFNLLDGKETVPAKVAGVGGFTEARIGSLDSFEVGGERFAKVRAMYITGSEGALTDAHTMGTFGSGILGPCQIVFDYAHRRIAFVRNAK